MDMGLNIDQPIELTNEILEQITEPVNITTAEIKNKRKFKHAWIIKMKSGFCRSDIDMDEVIQYLVAHLRINDNTLIHNYNDRAIVMVWNFHYVPKLPILEMNNCILEKVKLRGLLDHLISTTV